MGGPTAKIAFYGTLMSRFATQDELGVRDRLRLLGPCRIAGRLFDLGDWPTLVPGAGSVGGELFELLDDTVLATLDRFEDCDPADPARSSYLRVRMALLEPQVAAWVYVSNGAPAAGLEIPSGSWESGPRDQGVEAKRPDNKGGLG